jgi:hypothetical protein
MRALLSVLAVACLAGSAQAQQPGKQPPQQQPQTVRCIKDSFGNYTCTDGTRVIHDSFDPIVIPGREDRLAR